MLSRAHRMPSVSVGCFHECDQTHALRLRATVPDPQAPEHTDKVKMLWHLEGLWSPVALILNMADYCGI